MFHRTRQLVACTATSIVVLLAGACGIGDEETAVIDSDTEESMFADSEGLIEEVDAWDDSAYEAPAFSVEELEAMYYERFVSGTALPGEQATDEELTAHRSVTNYIAAPVPPTGCTWMYPGEGLGRGQSLWSCDGRFRMVMQWDGNLVLYTRGGVPLWSSRTAGTAGYGAYMQHDGNLVVYTSQGRALWSSRTPGYWGAFLAVQNDGNAVIYTTTGWPVWATHTGGR